MKKFLWIVSAIVICIIAGIAVIFYLLPKDDELLLKTDATVGVWWWTNQNEDEYLKFASKNGVDEIYYCDYELNEKTYTFVKKAKGMGFKVYALWGECDWIFDKSDLDDLIEKYNTFNETYSDAKFSGVHLDVEPHQLDEFGTNREAVMFEYVKFVYDVVDENVSVSFDFDIPFWAHDMVDYGGVYQPVFAHVIDKANRVFVMSYRDSADAIYEVAQEEVIYANQKGKTIALSVEMTSLEGDNVSFQEEGKEILYSELEKLEDKLSQKFIISIHNIKTWNELKEK